MLLGQLTAKNNNFVANSYIFSVGNNEKFVFNNEGLGLKSIGAGNLIVELSSEKLLIY